jgi:CO/xanthine dehydrogenase Mo-binding subunit
LGKGEHKNRAFSAGYAIANVTGKGLRDLPLTRKRIKDAIDA